MIGSKKSKRQRCVSEKTTLLRVLPPLVTSSKIGAISASDDKESASTIVGARVSVQWDDGVYEGSVSAFDKQRQHYRICYDDGDTEWIKIPHKDVKLMPSARGATSDNSPER